MMAHGASSMGEASIEEAMLGEKITVPMLLANAALGAFTFGCGDNIARAASQIWKKLVGEGAEKVVKEAVGEGGEKALKESHDLFPPGEKTPSKGGSVVGNTLDDIKKASTPVKKEALPDWIEKTFKKGKYDTVELKEDLIVYRAYGGKASTNGAFVTTLDSKSREEIIDKLALLPEWGNTATNLASIKIPAGTKINIGLVEKQTTKEGIKLNGGATQIVMPQDWPPNWIVNITTTN